MTDIDNNYSYRNAPDEWADAETFSDVETDNTPLGRRRVMPSVPTREQADLVTALTSGGIVALATGWLWYSYEIANAVEATWMAPVLGVAIAVGVRISGGGRHPDVRAAVSTVLYLLTVFAVAYLVERTQFLATYGDGSRFWNGNSALLRNRLSDLETVCFWLVGLFASIQTSYLLKTKK